MRHNYRRTVRSLWTWLWGRYHVPQNVFLVVYKNLLLTYLITNYLSRHEFLHVDRRCRAQRLLLCRPRYHETRWQTRWILGNGFFHSLIPSRDLFKHHYSTLTVVVILVLAVSSTRLQLNLNFKQFDFCFPLVHCTTAIISNWNCRLKSANMKLWNCLQACCSLLLELFLCVMATNFSY